MLLTKIDKIQLHQNIKNKVQTKWDWGKLMVAVIR